MGLYSVLSFGANCILQECIVQFSKVVVGVSNYCIVDVETLQRSMDASRRVERYVKPLICVHMNDQ